MNPELLASICAAIGVRLRTATQVAGGCINAAYRLECQDGARYFLKLGDAGQLPMFAAEAASLAAMEQAIRVPRTLGHGVSGGHSYLLLEYLKLHADDSGARLGERLAAMHRMTAPRFGFEHDNFIGTTPQQNAWADDWIGFWRDRRLGPQLQLAIRKGFRLQHAGDRLLAALPALLRGHAPIPSLLHGDLWSGNHARLPCGTPVVFDPAAYYGDRECDIAMTELFGGFTAGFYAAYNASFPLDSGYAGRRDLYTLYHLFNHANLFGAGYAKQAEQMMLRLTASIS